MKWKKLTPIIVIITTCFLTRSYSQESQTDETEAPYGPTETITSAETEAPYGTSETEANYGTSETEPNYGTGTPETEANYGTSETEPNYGTGTPETEPNYGTSGPETEPNYGTSTPEAEPNYGTSTPEAEPNYGTAETVAPNGTPETEPNYGTGTTETEPNYGTGTTETEPNYGTPETAKTETETPVETTETAVTEVNYNNTGGGNENETDANGNSTLIATDPNLLAFYLYPKQENLSYFEVLQYGDRSSVEKSSYNPTNPTVFFVHGFLNNYTTKYTQSMKNGYLQTGLGKKENIIAVDWGKLSTPENYTYSMTEPAYPSWTEMSSDLYYQAAVANAPRAGKRIAEFINFLTAEQFLAGPSAVHIIGFSLGAHVSGVAGNVIKKQNTTMVKRITGLDPAGPLYQNERDMEKKLDSTDASFVDVIHTNQGQEGYYGALGHADFHPNGGGPNQPNCQNANGNTVPDTMSGSCAHNRVWQFYIKALSENIQACKCIGNGNVDFVLCRTMCREKTPFGRNCPPTARGNYYLEI